MNSSMDPLDRELKSLPVVRASAGFTAEVLRRLDRAPLSGFRTRRHLGWAALAVGAAGIAALVLTLIPIRQRESARLASEASDIRRQHEMLTLELSRLRARTEGTAPVLYLGGLNEVDYVLDLSPFLLTQSGALPPTSPASNNKNTTFQVTKELQ